jgi:hypothetical protein
MSSRTAPLIAVILVATLGASPSQAETPGVAGWVSDAVTGESLPTAEVQVGH